MSDRMMEIALLVTAAGILAIYSLISAILGAEIGWSVLDAVVADLSTFGQEASIGLVGLLAAAACLAAAIVLAILRRIRASRS